MCTGRFSMIERMIAASVVDLPEPVGPVMSTSPAGMWTKVSSTSGSPSSETSGILNGMRRKTAATEPRWT